MGTLSLTFRGPFLFVVPPPKNGVASTTVNIYAPKCDGHLGSIFYGDGAEPLFGSFHLGGNEIYTLTGVTPPANGVISFQWNFDDLEDASPILSPDDQAIPSATASTFDNAYFCITVPRPKIFYSLNTVNDTGVVTEAGEPSKPLRSLHTAFRLFYDWDFSDIHLAQPSTVIKNPPILDITPPAGPLPGNAPKTWLPLPDVGDIEFQYEGPELSDADHQDASQCFDSIAKLAGLSWFLRFQNSGSLGGSNFRHGSDCLAIPIVIGRNN